MHRDHRLGLEEGARLRRLAVIHREHGPDRQHRHVDRVQFAEERHAGEDPRVAGVVDGEARRSFQDVADRGAERARVARLRHRDLEPLDADRPSHVHPGAPVEQLCLGDPFRLQVPRDLEDRHDKGSRPPRRRDRVSRVVEVVVGEEDQVRGGRGVHPSRRLRVPLEPRVDERGLPVPDGKAGVSEPADPNRCHGCPPSCDGNELNAPIRKYGSI